MEQERFNKGLCNFLQTACTPFHAVEEMARQLEKGRFQRLDLADEWRLQSGGRYYTTRNDSSLVAFVVGSDQAPEAGLRMVGAHTDSPCLMVKPCPETSRSGYLQLGVEVYGGALLNPWYDRDLSLAGRVSYRDSDGALRRALVNFRDPIAVIPSLAIHLDREANNNRSVNPQKDILPVLCRVAGEESRDLRDLLRSRLKAQSIELDVFQVLDYELSFYDTQAPALVGLERDFIASARLDNLLSCYAGLQALLESDGCQSALLVCNDHEEVGSLSASGAQGPFLAAVLRRLARGDDATFSSMVEKSVLISADNAHGVHPNYADRHDDNHGPLLNGGPVIKVNANQRYASNSETAGLWRLLAEAEQVPVQSFVVRSDMACGSTIGPITSGAIGVRTLDIGVPTFAMHSVRELAGSADAVNLFRVLRALYRFPGPLSAG